MVEAVLYDKLPDLAVRCNLCNHYCEIKNGYGVSVVFDLIKGERCIPTLMGKLMELQSTR